MKEKTNLKALTIFFALTLLFGVFAVKVNAAEDAQTVVTEYSDLWTGDITVQAGTPVKWYVNVPDDTNPIGCGATIKIPGLGWGTDTHNKNEGHLTLTTGNNFIYEFTPTEAGDILFTCWMGSGCHHNYIHVVDDEANPTENTEEAPTTPEINTKPINAEHIHISQIVDQQYTGKAITPDFIIIDGSYALKPNVDYTYEYFDNTEVGTATISIKGIGDLYSGEAKLTFHIVEPTTTEQVTENTTAPPATPSATSAAAPVTSNATADSAKSTSDSAVAKTGGNGAIQTGDNSLVWIAVLLITAAFVAYAFSKRKSN